LSFAQENKEQYALDFFADSIYPTHFSDSKIYFNNEVSSGLYRFHELQISGLQKWDSINMRKPNYIFEGENSLQDTSVVKCQTPLIFKKKLKKKSLPKSEFGWKMNEYRINPIQLNMKLNGHVIIDNYTYIKIELNNRFQSSGYTIYIQIAEDKQTVKYDVARWDK
jgi:hypothetical protein